MIRSATSFIAVLALVALLGMPTAASAADVQPLAIDDPPAAFEEPAESVTPAPGPEVATPTKPTESIDAGGEGTAEAAAGGTESLALDDDPVSIQRDAVVGSGAAQLPFTGVATDRTIALVFVATLLLLAGGALRALPRDEHAR